jgi:hypothetical protein
VDSFMTYDFLIPGVLLMWSGNYPAGTARAMDFAAPRLEDAPSNVTFTSQAVTPTGPKASCYFFSWGPRKGHGDEALRDSLMQLAGVAFAEDKVMIEAQQRVIERTPEPRIMPTAHDKGVTIFTRLVERLAKAERQSVRVAEEAA